MSGRTGEDGGEGGTFKNKMKLKREEETQAQDFQSIESLPLEIREIIFGHLSLQSLKTIRLTCKTLNHISSLCIARRDLTALTFKFSPMRNEYLHDLKSNQFAEFSVLTSKSLSYFLDTIQSSHSNFFSNFPCTNFTLIGGSLATHEIPRFFTQFSGMIKTLSLQPPPQTFNSLLSPVSIDFQNIWLDHLGGLEHLKIDCCHWLSNQRWTHVTSPFGSIQRHSLKTITSTRRKCVGCPQLFHDPNHWPLIFEILNFPPISGVPGDFNQFIGFQGNYIDFILAAGKLDCVKHYNFFIYTPFQPKIMENVLKFSLSGPKLRSLTFLDYRSSSVHPDDLAIREMIGQVLTSILKASQDSLKNFEMNALSNYPTVRIPLLEKLSTLTLYPISKYGGWTTGSDEFFPRDTDREKVFPNLRIVTFGKWTLELNCESRMREKGKRRSGNDGPNIQRFAYGDQEVSYAEGKTESIKSVLKFFGNVKKIVQSGGFERSVNFIEILGECGTEVEELGFVLDFGECTDERMDHFEGQLTGLDVESVRMLKGLDGREGGKKEEVRTVGGGLKNLKKLKQLKISLRTEEVERIGSVGGGNNFKLLSWISQEYAFKWMKSIQVIVAYDHRSALGETVIHSALESISSFVKIVHERH